MLTIPAPVGSGERLFGSVTNQDIADAIYAARKIRVDKRNVDLEEPIKTVGTFMVKSRGASAAWNRPKSRSWWSRRMRKA